MKHNMHRSRTLSTNQLHNTNGSNGEIEYQTFKEESHAKKQPPHPPKQNIKTYKKHTQKKKLTNNIQTKYNKQNTKTPTKTPSNFNDYYVYSVFQ